MLQKVPRSILLRTTSLVLLICYMLKLVLISLCSHYAP